MACNSRADHELKASDSEDDMLDQIIRIRHHRRRDQVVNLAVLLCINLALMVSVYLFSPPIKRHMGSLHSPSSFAYQTQPELSFIDQRTLERPSLDPRVEASLWSEAVSLDTGFVWIENPEEFKLPPGLPGGPQGERKLYGLSWGHQTHCLMMIRDEYLALLRNASDFIYGAGVLDATERARFHHIDHCFHYLRENIRCSRDMTLEWAADYPDELGNQHHIDGYGIPHQCRSERWVKRFTTAYKPGHETLMGIHQHPGDR